MAQLKLPSKLPVAGATLRRWRVAPGQAFAAGQILAELDAENALLHLTAQQAGVLGEPLAPIGQTLQAGAILAEMGNASDIDIPTSPSTGLTILKETPVTRENAPSGQAVPILMPQAGNTMEEGRVLAWKVKVGDEIAVGQVICEIETDKATMEFESPVAGRLAKIVVPDGEAAPVKTPIAYLGEGDVAIRDTVSSSVKEGVSQATTAAKPKEVTTPGHPFDGPAQSKPVPVSTDARPKISPAARALAAQQHLDPVVLASAGTGSGPGGRILSTDIPALAARLGTQTVAVPQTRPLSKSAETMATSSSGVSSDGVTRRPMSKMRRAIGLNLQQSKQTVPHFYVRQTIDAQPLLSFQKAMKPLAGCTLNDCILYLLARTMKAFPAFRSRLEGDTLVEFAAVNLGVAVGIEDGLVVPVLMNADSRSLADLSTETKRLIENARKGKLENLGKATFTVSNLGMFGVEEFAAIINPPESGILAVSAAREGVLVRDGALRASRLMTLTISADHRIVDGMLAAQFMAAFKQNLENPGNVA